MIADVDLEWQDDAACVGADPAIFYPNLKVHYSRRWPEHVMAPARRYCSICPVFADCHAYAIAHEREGIWAGTDPIGRSQIRRSLGIALVDVTPAPDPDPVDPDDQPDDEEPPTW